MRKWSGNLSRWLNHALGGEAGHTLCRRIAASYGTSCLFCRIIGAILREPDHCAREFD